MKTLVMGIGNLLLGDEGVGVHAVRELQRKTLPEDVRVMEIGTAILDALPELENADRVFIIDAMQYAGEPGSLYKIPLDRCLGSPSVSSMHGFDFPRVMAFTNRRTPLDAIVFGIEPDYVGWSLELSPKVQKTMPLLLKAVSQALHN